MPRLIYVSWPKTTFFVFSCCGPIVKNGMIPEAAVGVALADVIGGIREQTILILLHDSFIGFFPFAHVMV